ncbi:hypothetical protein Q763_12370 [Flavobacterium beibuense F44-8]|uniref:Uncharacterized protein n=1 Tax=Flavobacterium beibuense F44-8 TaxID=1406840 RepID=A0A0A2LIC4_9FLAO|nr:hypothetical protein [Flavobacterium beibuense]KGO79639.1 hypothetical protein Q763_12370 [Flavobacterium beibuense F44-8]
MKYTIAFLIVFLCAGCEIKKEYINDPEDVAMSKHLANSFYETMSHEERVPLYKLMGDEVDLDEFKSVIDEKDSLYGNIQSITVINVNAKKSEGTAGLHVESEVSAEIHREFAKVYEKILIVQEGYEEPRVQKFSTDSVGEIYFEYRAYKKRIEEEEKRKYQSSKE